MRLLGPCLVVGLYCIVVLHIYAYFTVITPLLKNRIGTNFGLIWIVVGLTLVYNIVFNHFYAVILKPGSPTDTKMIEKMRTEQKNRAYRKEVDVTDKGGDELFEGLSSDVKKLLRYRSKTTTELEEFWPKKCDTCKIIKPARAHHCSVCQQCVYLMDHHCPWINNCVGMENQRYFLLFVLYLMLGCMYMMVTIVALWHHHSFSKRKQMMNFIMILDAILCVVMAGFTGWNWMLALNGKTTIEFWTNFDKDRKLIELSFPQASDNLYRVFGTYKLFRVLSPSLRNVPFTGLEWSFWFKDSGYDANGYKFPETNAG